MEKSHHLQGFPQSHAVGQNSTPTRMKFDFANGVDRSRVHELNTLTLVGFEDCRQVFVHDDGRGVKNRVFLKN